MHAATGQTIDIDEMDQTSDLLVPAMLSCAIKMLFQQHWANALTQLPRGLDVASQLKLTKLDPSNR